MRGDFPGHFTKGIFWFDQGLKPGDSFCFRYCWMILFVSEFGFFHNGKIGTKMTHTQILLNMSTHRPLCFILQALNQL